MIEIIKITDLKNWPENSEIIEHKFKTKIDYLNWKAHLRQQTGKNHNLIYRER